MTAINLPIYFGGSRVVSSSADAASLILTTRIRFHKQERTARNI